MGRKTVPADRPTGATWCGKCRAFRVDADFSPSFVKRGRGTCRTCVNASSPRAPEKRAAWYARNRKDINVKSRARYWRDPSKHRVAAREYHARRVEDPTVREAIRVRAHFKGIRRQFGMTPEEYEARIASQGGGCAICGRPQGSDSFRLAVDHCHETGAVRGVLCRFCNLGIGLLGDSAAGVRRAAAYLARPLASAACGQIPDSDAGSSAGLMH